jgi:hypothetical protein
MKSANVYLLLNEKAARSERGRRLGMALNPFSIYNK